jgi:AraC-like DNA-binding protein
MKIRKSVFRNYTESKSVFRTHFVLFLITILIPTCIFLGLQIYRVSQNSIEKIESASKADLARASRNLDVMLDLMNQITLQTSLNPDILDMLAHPFDQTVYQYAQIKEQLRGWTNANPLFHSIYLGILQNRRVLTTNEGIYDMDRFYDELFMRDMEEEGPIKIAPWIGIHKIDTALEESGSAVLTFVRTVPVTQLTPQGILVFNLRQDIFLNTLQTMQAEQRNTILIFDPENQSISRRTPELDAEKIAGELAPGATRSSVIHLSDRRHILIAQKLPSSGFTIMMLAPYDAYNEQVAHAMRQAVLTLLVVFALGTALSYYLASIMYVPWRRLAERLQAFANKPPADSRDAFAFVNHAIHDLIASVRKNEPLVRDRVVQELLHDRIPDSVDVTDRLRESAIHFDYAHFAVLVVSSEHNNQRGNTADRMLYLYSMAEETLLASFPCAGTILDNARFGFILNVDCSELNESLKERIAECCREIRGLADSRLHAGLFFCISGIQTLDNIHQAYEQVKRTLAYKAFATSDIYFAERTEETTEFPYSVVYQKYILNAILALDRDATAGYISELFDKYLANSIYPYPKLLQMILILMSHMISSLAQEGYDIAPLMNEIDLLQLQQCRNRHELQQLILTQTGRVIGYLESSREKAAAHSPGVQKAMGYIEEHYADNMSISDIAAVIGISASHLSRIFKAEVGKSPLEYLTEYRLNHSKRLLADGSCSLNIIVEAIGYNDVHTFIRSFKKVEGITPGEYRKRLMNQI